MPSESSASRSSHCPPRYSSYPGSALASAHRSPLPSEQQRPSSDNALSPYSACYHPAMNSACPNFQPLSAPQSSSSAISESEHGSGQHPSTQPFAPAPLFQGPHHPVTGTAYSDSTVLSHAIRPPPNSHHPNAVRQRLLRPAPAQASISHRPTYYGQGMFNAAHSFSVTDSTFIDNKFTSNNFVEKLLQCTIIGAEFDSSDRYPPPRCHPGTRLAIVERCKAFITQCEGKEKIRWVVGPAGVGKSAIMQIVAEETPADASVFFSINGRQEGAKLFTTIAYQLAAKREPYRQFIQREISRDPSLLRKSLLAQFRKFIVDPFIHQRLFSPSDRFTIIIDGLDECHNPLMELGLLKLISAFCILCPTSPVVWLIASRPEPHITSFFDNTRIRAAYTKEEIMIDSDEACEDVQRYLRDELNEIKMAYPTLRHKRGWPSELHFTKIATAAGGLFSFASTVVRYINDPHYRDPATRLCHVLETIDACPGSGVPGRDHPMARLDALYKRILSNVPADVMVNTRKLLLIYSSNRWSRGGFRSQCNILGLTEAAAYGAICHLHAVAKVPMPDKAYDEHLEYYHTSFKDFLFDFNRSGFSHNVREEARRLLTESYCRIIAQVPSNFEGIARENIACEYFGYLKAAPNFCDAVSLSWPADEQYQTSDDQLRLRLYRASMHDIYSEYLYTCEFDGDMFRFQCFTTRFATVGPHSPLYGLRDTALGRFRSELTELGKLKQVPLRALDYAAICGRIDFRFTSPTGMDIKPSDPWNPSCEHDKDNVDGLQQRRGWSTSFKRYFISRGGDISCADVPRYNIRAGRDCHWDCLGAYLDYVCLYCLQRFARHLINNPNQLATVFIDSTEMCYVELLFVDPDDGVSEWRYRFFHSGLPAMH